MDTFFCFSNVKTTVQIWQWSGLSASLRQQPPTGHTFMTPLKILEDHYGPSVLSSYRGIIKAAFTPPLDAKGTIVKEWLYRKHKLKSGSEFFSVFSDDELVILLSKLQDLAHKKEHNHSLVDSDQMLHRAFRRSISKLSKLGSNLI